MSRKKRRKLPRIVRILILLVCVGVLAYLGVVGYVWIRERSVPTDLKQGCDCDAIVVLGAQVKKDGELSVQLRWRLDAAAEAYEQITAKGKAVQIVVCGAQGKDEPEPEAYAMQRYLSGKGIPTETILADPDSFNTKQNLENARKLLGDAAGKVLIVTSDYHVPRAMALAEDVGFEAEGLGSPCLPEYWIKNHSREALAWCKYWVEKIFHISL